MIFYYRLERRFGFFYHCLCATKAVDYFLNNVNHRTF